MINTSKLYECWNGIIGWKNYFDTNIIPALPPELNESSSGEFFNDFHPACKLDIIMSILPEGMPLDQYLSEITERSIKALANQLHNEQRAGKNLTNVIADRVLIDGHGWANDTIINENRFVGVQFRTKNFNSLTNLIKAIGFQGTFIPDNIGISPTNGIPIYVYHSKLIEPIALIYAKGDKSIQWNWTESFVEMSAWNETYDGGVFVIGYYQEDIEPFGNAINTKSFNWTHGPCGTCNGGINTDRVKGFMMLKKTLDFIPIYVPQASLNVGREMFNIEDAFENTSSNWGLNFKIQSSCDYTYFMCNKHDLIREAIGLKVAHELLKDYRYSPRINYLEESIRNMMAIDIEGAPKTVLQAQEYLPLADRLRVAIEGVKFDMTAVDQICLDCTDISQPTSYSIM